MSTNNFAFDNVLVVFDCGHEDCECYEETTSEVVGDLLASFKEGYTVSGYLNDHVSRSYGGSRLFAVYILGRGCVYKTVEVIARSGYYGGWNMDYVVSDIVDDDSYTEGKTKTLDGKVQSVCSKIEKILKSHGTVLRKVGQFSNGEAVYEKAI